MNLVKVVRFFGRYNPPEDMNITHGWSGAVTIEVENPSGYCITPREATLEVLRTKNKTKNLIDVKADFPMVHWYFSKVR